MRVSIIIPVYNAEKYLEECINSTINQTYPDIEIIAVNDGSIDNSLQILQKYSNKVKIISKENGGTASALNAGIKSMTGEWFKWLSADDVLYSNCIEELILEAKNLDGKNFILYSSYDTIDSEGKTIDQFIEPNYNNLGAFDFNVILLDHYIGNGTTSLIHKSVIDKFGMFDQTIGYKEDYELWLRYCILCNCRLHLVPKILAKYRIHKKQLTKEKVRKSHDQSEKIRKLVLDKLCPAERSRYEIALQKYKKNRTPLQKMMYFGRYNIFSVLPPSISNRLLDLYWYTRKKKLLH
jgi:glycosyltransferase involved in cell wall biosynthesis